MRAFKYLYKGETVETLFAISMDYGHLHYKVKLSDDRWFTIVPLTDSKNNIIWKQLNKEFDGSEPEDLVIAMGEGLEAYG